MDLELKGRVAVITGAGSQKGFGKGIALALAREGCDIAVCDIDLKGVEQTAADVRALGQKAIALKTDVTSRDEVNDMVKKVLDQFGKVDILVNNAGAGTMPKPFVQSEEKEWASGLNLNLLSVIYCTRAVLPQMLERKHGKIVNLSSVAGLIGVPNGSIYAAAKAGVAHFTACVALEVADLGVNINCIAPGLGNTNFHAAAGFPESRVKQAQEWDAIGKSITPRDIGNMVAFLASDASRHVVGQCIRVSGTT